MSTSPAKSGSVGYCMLRVTGPAVSENSVTAPTRKSRNATSDCCKLPRARASWSSRIWVSSVSFWRFSDAAVATKRSATAFTVAATSSASCPDRSSRRKLPSTSALTFIALASNSTASSGGVTSNSTRRRGRKAAGGGTHAKPSAAPTESPATPRPTTP